MGKLLTDIFYLIKMDENIDVTREQLSRYEVIGAVIYVGVLGFWFGIGAALGDKMVNSLKEIISR